MDEVEMTSGSVSLGGPAFIRQARPDDLHALQDVDTAVFGELAYPLFVLRQFIDVHHRHFLVADADPPLLGYVLAAFAAGADDAWLLGLGVRPDARQYGHGRALMHRCLDRLRGDGVRRVLLTVKTENTPAIKLYESIGFKNMGYRQHYYGDDEGRYMMIANLGTQASETSERRVVP
jgi:ribosomal-protein-alanine N-acetyltransferase